MFDDDEKSRGNQPLNNNRYLAISLKEIKQGRSVFPCIGKIPATKGGKGCQDATTDESQIYEWAKQFPNANVGITAKNEARKPMLMLMLITWTSLEPYLSR
jgi:hypothetical protein